MQKNLLTIPPILVRCSHFRLWQVCGAEYTVVLAQEAAGDGSSRGVLFASGENGCGQLGLGEHFRNRAVLLEFCLCLKLHL